MQQGMIFEQDGLSYLAFDLPSEIVISKNMLDRMNGFPYLLPVEMSEKAGGCVLTYQAGICISLSKYLKQNKLSANEIVDLIQVLCETLKDAEESDLYEENLSFKADNIFQDVSQGKTFFTYFPFETKQQAIPAFKHMLSKIIQELLIADEDNEETINTIKEYCDKQGFSICGLMDLLAQQRIYIQVQSKHRKRKKKPKKPKEQGFWSRLFAGKKNPPIPEDEVETLPEEVSESNIKKDGTELLIPEESTESLNQKITQRMCLSIVSSGMATQAEIFKFPCVIGRSPQEASIVLEDGSISRKHAIIDYRGGEFVMIDNNSSNGVVINELKLNPGVAKQIVTNDIIKIGRITLRVDTIVGD